MITLYIYLDIFAFVMLTMLKYVCLLGKVYTEPIFFGSFGEVWENRCFHNVVKVRDSGLKHLHFHRKVCGEALSYSAGGLLVILTQSV